MFDPDKSLVIQLMSFVGIALALVPQVELEVASGSWERPVVGSVLVNSYRQSETPYSAGHRGVDFAVSLGQGVFAPADGTVHFVGKVVDRQLISIRHNGNLISAFEPVCSVLSVGAQVFTGDLIGEVCEPDQEYQPHCQDQFCLHFSARKNDEYLSPLWLTGDLAPARLLPWIEP